MPIYSRSVCFACWYQGHSGFFILKSVFIMTRFCLCGHHENIINSDILLSGSEMNCKPSEPNTHLVLADQRPFSGHAAVNQRVGFLWSWKVPWYKKFWDWGALLSPFLLAEKTEKSFLAYSCHVSVGWWPDLPSIGSVVACFFRTKVLKHQSSGMEMFRNFQDSGEIRDRKKTWKTWGKGELQRTCGKRLRNLALLWYKSTWSFQTRENLKKLRCDQMDIQRQNSR